MRDAPERGRRRVSRSEDGVAALPLRGNRFVASRSTFTTGSRGLVRGFRRVVERAKKPDPDLCVGRDVSGRFPASIVSRMVVSFSEPPARLGVGLLRGRDRSEPLNRGFPKPGADGPRPGRGGKGGVEKGKYYTCALDYRRGVSLSGQAGFF